MGMRTKMGDCKKGKIVKEVSTISSLLALCDKPLPGSS